MNAFYIRWNIIVFSLIGILVGSVYKVQSQTYVEVSDLPGKANQSDSIPIGIGRYADSLLNIYKSETFEKGEKLLTKEYFDFFFNKYFSYLSTAKVGLPDGNSVSLQPTTNSTRIQANLSHKSTYTIYNFGFLADFSDNIANIFSSRDVTASTSFYTNISFLNSGSRLLKYDANKAVNFNTKKIFAIEQYRSALELKFRVQYSLDSLAYMKKCEELDSVINAQVLTKLDSNDRKIVKLRDEFLVLRSKLASYGLNEKPELYTVNGLMDDILQQQRDSLKNILDTMEVSNPAWTSFRFGWFSTGLTYTRQQYKTYDSTLYLSKRINDLPFNNVALTIGYNFILQRSDQYLKTMSRRFIKSFYLNAAYSIGNDLNYSHMDALDLLTITERKAGDTTYQFQSTAKVRDISGKTKEVDWLHNFGIQTTLILSNTNFMGLNFGLSGSFGKLTVPIYTGRLGLLFRFINSDDQKSKINFEMFIQLPDWNDSKSSDKSTWQRKVIGFNATIPFGKLFY